MSIAAVYLVRQCAVRTLDFLNHWYVGGFRRATHWTLLFLERLDRTLALRVTLRYFFRPLYQDYSFVGYFFGFLFRIFRALVAFVIYAAVIACAVALYLVWAFAPIYIVYAGFGKQ